MEILQVDTRSKAALAFLEFCKSLSFVKFVKRSNELNEETEQAILDARDGNIVSCKNSEDLFQQLGI